MPRLDATGLLCPLPVLLARREAARLAPGESLEVVGDDPAMVEDFRSWCAETGHTLVSFDESCGRVRVILRLRAE